MSIVRFASVCDQCGKRGPEYQAYLSCGNVGLIFVLSVAIHSLAKRNVV